MDDTQTQVSGDDGEIPLILDGDELYDGLMGGIEPELMIEEIPLLKEKYAGETPEESQERATRYSRAFEEFYRQLGEYGEYWHWKVKEFQREAIASLEEGVRAEEEEKLNDIDSKIANI